MNQRAIKSALNIVLTFTLLLAGVYAYGLFELERKAVNVDATYNDVLVQLKKQDDLQVARNVFRETSSIRSNIDSRIIAYEEIPEFLASIEKLASSSNVSRNITQVTTSEKEELSALDKQSLDVSFSATGSWDNVFHFISLIETLPYKINLRTADLARHTEIKTTESGTGKDKKVTQEEIKNWSVDVAISVIIHKKK